MIGTSDQFTGVVTLVKAVPLKAYVPIRSILFEKVTLVKLPQLRNALSEMLVTPLSKTTDLILPLYRSQALFSTSSISSISPEPEIVRTPLLLMVQVRLPQVPLTLANATDERSRNTVISDTSNITFILDRWIAFILVFSSDSLFSYICVSHMNTIINHRQ